MVDFLAEYPDPRTIKLYEDLPDEVAEIYITQTSFEEQVWQLFFDGASRTGARGIIMAGVRVNHGRSKGNARVSTKLRDFLCILTN